MISIELENPITTTAIIPTVTRIGFMEGLETHFNRAGSTIGAALATDGTDHTLYLWPLADPSRWVWALSTIGAHDTEKLAGYMDYGQDPTGVSLPPNPTTWMTPPSPGGVRTPVMGWHFVGVSYDKLVVTEFGDAVYIGELHSSESYFLRNYHFGEIYAPVWKNAESLGFRGLGMFGGTGHVATGNTSGSAAGWFSGLSGAATGAGQASCCQFGNNWVTRMPSVNAASTNSNNLGGKYVVGAWPAGGNIGIAVTTSANQNQNTYFGILKYLGFWDSSRAPGTLVTDSVNQVQYMHFYITSAATPYLIRTQYGVSGLFMS